MTQFSRIVSYLFHPLFMPFLGVVLVLHTGSYIDITITIDLKYKIYLLLGLNIIAMPLISMLVMKMSRMISSFEMPDRSERTIPFMVVLVYYGLTYYLLWKGDLPIIFQTMFMGVIISLLAVLVINLRWKISIHMVGMGGLVGGFLAFAELTSIENWWPLLLLILAMGMVGTARLALGAHKPLQVYLGAVLGFICVFSAVNWELTL